VLYSTSYSTVHMNEYESAKAAPFVVDKWTRPAVASVGALHEFSVTCSRQPSDQEDRRARAFYVLGSCTDVVIEAQIPTGHNGQKGEGDAW
jgi:hypothetical protein